MFDTIIVVAIIAIAAFFVGRKLYRQLSTKDSGCGCSGCGQSVSCTSIQNKPNHSGCCDSR